MPNPAPDLPVHALAHRPLTPEAVAELLALPATTELRGDEDATDAELARRGWTTDDAVFDGYMRTGHGHMHCCDNPYEPFGDPEGLHLLAFGELYPVDPEDEDMTNGPWLYGQMEDWATQPGWTGLRPATVGDCEAVLAQAAQAVTEQLGAGPERTVVCDATVVTGSAMTHRIWRTATHALVLGPHADNGPYGYLTHLQLSLTPLDCGPELPPAEDEKALTRWITAHVDW
ncbi:hypothetical protein [Streptomyces sp. N35]|uniref:hypothetical protein n=1 Tax=Streptomyces sp. N35 TaxID=2795730 RepID=UPI001F1F077A|nr:hypothetical protein [Streptomyces sp. N35]